MTVTFNPPGPGQWALDQSHYPSGVTPLSQSLLKRGLYDGIERVFKELGMPATSIAIEFVNGFAYSRLQPLIGANSKPRKPPPDFVLKAVTRLHPEFRERNKRATATLRDSPSNAVVHRWEHELRPQLVSKNKAFQGFDPHAATDDDLQQHITNLVHALHESFELHFWLHGHDLGPIARYLHTALSWDLSAGDAVAALAGASPSTGRPIGMLCELRAMVEASPSVINDLEDVRALSPDAQALLDTYLGERGCILATGYDLDDATLGELPSVVLTSIKTATAPPAPNHDEVAAGLRAQIPNTEHAKFDQLLADARNVMDMRDDNGPLTIEWPMGLLRRALLAAGERLHERNKLDHVEHILEVDEDEVHRLFTGSTSQASFSTTLADRAAHRAKLAKLEPPAVLGPDEPEPPLDALPSALGELVSMTNTAMQYMGMTPREESFTGVGIGTDSYIGIARVADSASDAIHRLEPGQVLVVRATSPAFNVVLGIAGAVVTADGGALSHAAVLSRELGIPAVIGAGDALSIPDGATIEVDPKAGTVRVL